MQTYESSVPPAVNVQCDTKILRGDVWVMIYGVVI
jgi:hypothetical protein